MGPRPVAGPGRSPPRARRRPETRSMHDRSDRSSSPRATRTQVVTRGHCRAGRSLTRAERNRARKRLAVRRTASQPDADATPPTGQSLANRDPTTKLQPTCPKDLLLSGRQASAPRGPPRATVLGCQWRSSMQPAQLRYLAPTPGRPCRSVIGSRCRGVGPRSCAASRVQPIHPRCYWSTAGWRAAV
jgi:hypothetical protein